MKLLNFDDWAEVIVDEIIDGGLSRRDVGKLLSSEFSLIFKLGIDYKSNVSEDNLD